MSELDPVTLSSSASVGPIGWTGVLEGLEGEARRSLEDAVRISPRPCDSRMLMAAVLTAGQELSIATSARVILLELQKQRPRDQEDVLGILGLESEKHVDRQLSPQALAEETRRVLLAAGSYAARFDEGKIQFRHLLIALLAPGEQPPAVQNFLRIRGYNLKRLRHRLLEYISSTYGEEPFWKAILSGQPIAHLAHDQPVGDDCLDIDAEVRALCRVLMAKQVEPPISLGLFGNWGTGKSFFMERMHSMIEQVAQQEAIEEESTFCSKVVQIRFNAGHYLDSNLWASLVTQIFAKLFESVSHAEEQRQGERQTILGNLTTAKVLHQEAAAEVAKAGRATAQAEEVLREAQAKREEKEATFLRRLNKLVHILADHKDIQTKIDSAVVDLGLEPTVSTVEELQGVLSEASSIKGRLQAVVLSVLRAPGGKERLFWIFLAVALPFFFSVLLDQVLPLLTRSATTQSILTWFTNFSAFLVSAGVWLRAQVLRVSRAIQTLGEAQKDVQKAIEDQRQSEEEKRARQELEILRENEASARTNLRTAEANLMRAREDLKEAQSAQRFYRFIEERSASADYSKQLGIVSFVRRDFERLSQLMAKTSKLGFRAERADEAWCVAAIDDEGIELQTGDLIKSINGQDASKVSVLESTLDGDFARWLKVQRQGKELDVRLDLGKGGDPGFLAERTDGAWRISAVTRTALDLKPGDIILSLNGRKAEAIEDFAQEMRSETWRLEVDRQGRIIEVAYEVPPELPIERIFLYIDDLDRCKPRRVIEVLEAVHLLLAFKLFVVVVGVDPRWLSQALLSQYRSLLGAGRRQLADSGSNDRDVATPQDYLEKIFQIPYILRPVGTGGYSRLIKSLAPLAVEAEMDSGDQLQRRENSGVPAASSPKAYTGQAELFPPLLRLEPSERQLMEKLGPLFSTPRTVKRFVNLYQMFRARVAQTELPEFLGQNGQPGRFFAIQILLAIISSYPSLAGELLRRLVEETAASSSRSWDDFVMSLPQLIPSLNWPNDRWAELLRGLRAVSLVSGWTVPTLGTFAELVPQVARFSFSLEPIPELRSSYDNALRCLGRSGSRPPPLLSRP